MNRYKKSFIYFNILLTLMFLNTGFALGEGRRLIVDAEIESYIKSLIKPLTTVAKLDNNSLTIHLVEDESLNAFVTRGQKLFLHTGLLINTKNPAQLRGILAHEIGHIAEGHLARTSKVLRTSSNITLLGVILGTATAAVTGRSEAAAAIFHGTKNMANKAFLKHSRTQESAADHAALRYLKKNQQTAQGLLEFLMTLKKKELLSTTNRSSYLDTHPLTDDRIEFVREHIKKSVHISQEEPSINIARHSRMVGKLIGFLHPPSKTFTQYPNPTTNIAAKYARVIGLHRNLETKKALIFLNELIENSPSDAYFWELKGQLLFETSQPMKAQNAYQKA